MATAVSLRKNPLLDLGFLTPEERAKLEAVIRADQNLLMQDRVRVGTLRQELEKERYFQKQLLNKPQCTCCEQRLGRLFNTGAPCPNCLYRVCKRCRVLSQKPPPPFVCPVCAKKRLLDIQAADYVPMPTADFSPSPLFGSQLVMMSLEAVQSTEPIMVNPYNGKARKKLNPSLSRASSVDSTGKPRTGTNDSAIVVRYSDSHHQQEGVANGRSESSMSTWSNTSSIGRRERPSSLPQARRLSPSEYSGSDEEDERNVLEVPGLSKLKHSESISSIGSLTSMYSAVGGKGDYAITGEICFGVWYSKDGLLKVHVDQARNLAAARKEGYSYPYVKVYLLPDRSKHTKRKTGFIRRTVSPKYDETFKYKLSESDLSSRTVWLSVWDWDRFGRNQFLGEVKLPLSSLDLTDNTDHWHTLLDQDESAQLEMVNQYRGRLLLGLMFQLNEEPPRPPPPPGKNRKPPRRKGVLHIGIRRAEDLPKMDASGLTNAVVKCYLLPSRTSSNKRKTQVVMNSLAPVWDEEFVYKTSEKELLGERVLEVTIWDYDKRGSNDFIGGLRVGPARSGSASQGPDWMDSFGEEVTHWQMVLSRPGEWVEQWHTLRPRMDRAVTSLPERPQSRELSPVTERLSPPLEEEEEKEAKNGAKSASSSPGTSNPRSNSVSVGDSVKMGESAAIASGKAKTLPARGEPARPNGRKPSPLMKSRKKQEEVAAGDSDPRTTTSHSPSPIPQLLVTSEPTEGEVTEPAALSHSASSTSLHSIGLSDGEIGKGDYDISGDVQLGFFYESGKLLIHVNRARDLAAADSNGLSDPYIKTYLLPDTSKNSKRKTGVKKKTVNPNFNETLEYSVSESELSSRTVWLSVWDWDRFGRNQFLGEVKLPLSSLDFTSETELWYPLVDKDQPYNINPSSSQLHLALRFTPRETDGGVTRGTLAVRVKRARNLFPSGEDSVIATPCRSYVTCTLLPDSSQRKASTVEESSHPTWREIFIFEGVTVEEIAKERVLEVSVWDSSDDRFIGGLRTGPLSDGTSQNREWMDSIGDEVSHWQMVLVHPGEWAEHWHTLRRNMKPTTSSINIANGNQADEFRKIAPKKHESPKHTTKSPRESPSKTNSPKKEAAHLTSSKDKKVDDSRHERHKPRPPWHREPQTTAAKHDELRKTVPKDAHPTTSSLDEEFRKVMAIPSNVPPQKSATLGKTITSSGKPAEDQFSEPGSSSSFPRSVPPLTLEEIARSSDPLHPRSISPEMPPPSSNIGSPGSTLERSSNQMMPSGPLKRVGLLGVGGSRSSLGSQMSIYSAAGGGKGNYDISGEVLLSISYHSRDRALLIHVNRARDLAAADSNGLSDPYIKTYLLPDTSKNSKRKTSIARKTLNPVYNQTLKYTVSQSELVSQTVWLSVWDWDRFGRNQFLGEVRLPLASFDLSDSTERWYTLQDRDDDQGTTDFYRGQLNLALRYTPSGTKKGKTRGSLDIIVKKGRDFPSMGGTGKPDPVVKCYLLPDKSSSGKRKVGVIKNQSDPVWEEMVSYEKVVLEEMVKERVLEVTVWDWDKKGSSFIGGLRIGPAPDGTSRNKDWMDSIGDEVSHWETVLAHPGEWAEQWHTLRTTMDPRSVSYQ